MTKEETVFQILFETFNNNKSTNFVIKQDNKREKRLETLIRYSIFYGINFGKIYLSEDKTACAITLDTSRKKTTLKSVFWDIKLVFSCIGIGRLSKVMKRESLIKKEHPKNDFIHLWYIGVSSNHQGKNKGTTLINEIIQDAKSSNKRIVLETSTERNYLFYERIGFCNFVTIDELGYKLKMYIL